MRVYTVTGLLDEETGELFVAGKFLGRQPAVGAGKVTDLPPYGMMIRFTGYFEASSPEEAERIAVDVASHYTDEDAPSWAPRAPRRPFRAVETVKTDKL